MSLWRYNTDGTLDNSFDGDGFISRRGAAGGALDNIYNLHMDSDGKILATGYSRNAATTPNLDTVIWRLIP